MDDITHRWLNLLGYEGSGSLHVADSEIDVGHGYAPEIQALLNPKGDVRATAVFDVDGVPTVCFVKSDGSQSDAAALRRLRRCVWNQNLVTVILAVDSKHATPIPVLQGLTPEKPIALGDASATGEFSRLDIESGEVQHRLRNWFDPQNRVDRDLLRNLGAAVKQLSSDGIGLDKGGAQYLMGQVLFVSYLEHRGIVSDAYRNEHGVRPLHDLMRDRDRSGLEKLFTRLKEDFNGDFLVPNQSASARWRALSDEVLALVDRFLKRADLEGGQDAFWGYDFRHIPVELLSGIYETFLADNKKDLGAYYTPRHLATLVVKQALAHSKDPTQERIYDGACGSGILLTTAFRQVLARAERDKGKRLRLQDRIRLLRRTIFGSDIEEAACRVTALSLYLALLDNLAPQDLSELSVAKGQRVLPELMVQKNSKEGFNLYFGTPKGDYFSDDNPLAAAGRATVLISNPPWGKPKKEATTTYDKWVEDTGKTTVRRQVAMAFAQRTISSVNADADARICLILPVGALLAPTSQPFIQDWLQYVHIERVINFGDLRKLLFPEAKHGCVVVLARVRKIFGEIAVDEMFDYWVPKADVSLALGRLSIYGRDRHRVLTSSVADNNEILRTLYWGGDAEREVISRLSLLGSVGRLVEHEESGWTDAKGFHVNDRHVLSEDRVRTTHLRKAKYLTADRIPHHEPVLDTQSLTEFPKDIKTIAWEGAENGAAFAGPRVIFPDGATKDLEVRAVYVQKPFSFKHSIGAIVMPAKDAKTGRFLAAYLHSDLARFLVLHTAYSLAVERERVSVKEILRLPFCRPEDHPDPTRAARIVRELANEIMLYERKGLFEREASLPKLRSSINKAMAAYFDLTEQDQQMVHDTCEYVIPSLQPGGYSELRTKLHMAPRKAHCGLYAESLARELETWRRGLNGTGHFEVDSDVAAVEATRGFGIVKVTLHPGEGTTGANVPKEIKDQAVAELLSKLRREGVLEPSEAGGIYGSGSWRVVSGLSMYMIKPLVMRAWLASEAAADAQRIVDATRAMPEEEA